MIAGSAGELTSFLGEHTPFQVMSDEELAELVAGSAVVEFDAGAAVADYSSRVPDDVWMVYTGNVALQATGDGTTIDTVAPGGIFGYMPLLAGGGMDFVARTTVPSTLIRLPGALVRAQFAKPAGLAFLASSGWNIGTTDRPTIAPATDSRPVAELVHGEALLVSPDTTVRDAVVRMTEQHVSYALIRLPDGDLGIFTDRDLRTRVVAAGLPVDVPIGGVMSAPARTVTADLTADTVLMEMLECGMRHMPVVTASGAVVGVLEDADLLAASARQSFILRRAIGLAANATELQKVGQRVTGMAGDLFRNGTKASATSAILSVVIDSLVRKALELALAEADHAPSDGFAWLTLGSVARREAMPSSDVDSGLSWRDGVSSESTELRAVARRVHEILDGCGLPSDRNGAVAFEPYVLAVTIGLVRRGRGVARRSVARQRVNHVVACSSTGGSSGATLRCTRFPPLTADGRRASERVAATAARCAVGKGRTRSLRDVLSRRGGTFDLKNHAVTPIVNLARWGGLTAGVTSATTPSQARRGRAGGRDQQRDAETLCDVFVDVAAAAHGTPGRTDRGGPHAGGRDHDV